MAKIRHAHVKMAGMDATAVVFLIIMSVAMAKEKGFVVRRIMCVSTMAAALLNGCVMGLIAVLRDTSAVITEQVSAALQVINAAAVSAALQVINAAAITAARQEQNAAAISAAIPGSTVPVGDVSLIMSLINLLDCLYGENRKKVVSISTGA